MNRIKAFLHWAWHGWHRHRWKATHVNQWYISTRERCSCGLAREIQSTPAEDGITLNHWWIYSDGSREPDERVFKHT